MALRTVLDHLLDERDDFAGRALCRLKLTAASLHAGAGFWIEHGLLKRGLNLSRVIHPACESRAGRGQSFRHTQPGLQADRNTAQMRSLNEKRRVHSSDHVRASTISRRS